MTDPGGYEDVYQGSQKFRSLRVRTVLPNRTLFGNLKLMLDTAVKRNRRLNIRGISLVGQQVQFFDVREDLSAFFQMICLALALFLGREGGKGVDDWSIARAATDVAVKLLLNLRLGRLLNFTLECEHRHNHATGTKAALSSIVVRKPLLYLVVTNDGISQPIIGCDGQSIARKERSYARMEGRELLSFRQFGRSTLPQQRTLRNLLHDRQFWFRSI